MRRRSLALLAALTLASSAGAAHAASRVTDPYLGPPDTQITSGPTGAISIGRPTFEFSATEPGSTFMCRFDDGDFTACASPYASPQPLTQGEHTFQVFARDLAGNEDRSPAERTFTVDRNVSGANVSAKRSQKEKRRRVTLKITVSASEAVRVTARGSIDIGKRKLPLKSRTVTLAGGRRQVILGPLNQSSNRRILAQLRERKAVVANLTGTFVDALGNRATSGTVEIKLKR